MEVCRIWKSPIPEPLKMGAIVLTTLPIVLVYPFVQKIFCKRVVDWFSKRIKTLY